MTQKHIRLFISLLVLLVLGAVLPASAQITTATQMYRDDAKGDYQYLRKGILDGNRIRTYYFNTTEVAHWPDGYGGEWPKGTGHNYIDGLTVLIGAKIKLPSGRVITPIEAHYREEFDYDPVLGNQYPWDLEPVPGYINSSSTSPANSVDTTTWPAQWPVALRADGVTTAAWDGYWYGYFGRGVKNADMETFFVVDDSKDAEFTRTPYFYYPIASDSARGGLGIRVEVRAFQWSHVLAEDCIFWHYDIVNLADAGYDTCAFGFYSDPGVGTYQNSTPDNSAYYSTGLDLCYAWAAGGVGYPDSWKTGYYGYAYLESPGNPWDGIDNDGDGLIDERRDNGVDDDGDWQSFSDDNGNGKWDVGEALNDDLGADGVGPYDEQYTGADDGEGDGKPTLGEPNFDKTDKDESDQIGLTAVALNVLGDKSATGVWPKNDDVMWERMNDGFKDTVVNNANIGIVFASGPFPLTINQRERFSMALVYGLDLDALVFNKKTVQNIYNANYNFSKPPYTPHATFVAGDHRVFIYWDSRAEKSRDSYLNNKLDFEGYLVYRSTDAEFNDIKLITDSQGNAKYYEPIAQFDLADSIQGPDPVGINGARFWRGSNTGLQHSFVDTSVVNGMTYYYAVVSYDMGDSSIGLQPTECPKIITQASNGTISYIDINCAAVTPNAAAGGYVAGSTTGDLSRVASGIGTGSMNLQILNANTMKNGCTYKVVFTSTDTIPYYKTSSYSIFRTSSTGTVDTMQSDVSTAIFGKSVYGLPFDGMVMSLVNDTAIVVNDTACGWTVGTPGVIVTPKKDNLNAAHDVAWPADYQLKWYSDYVDTAAFSSGTRFPKMPVYFQITNLTTGNRAKFIVDDADKDGTLSYGDTIRIIENYSSSTKFNLTYMLVWDRASGLTVKAPEAGDTYVLKTRRPYYTGDYFQFKTDTSSVNKGLAKTQMDKISVVPNPYICAAAWEQKTLYTTGRGERKIYFTHLPAQCTVRIYTVAGYLVKTLTKDSNASDGSLSWDLVTEDGMDIAFGLYIYHVDAPGVGEHIGKFAVIK